MTLSSPSSQDVTALSKSRNTDSTGNGQGTGRRASGFQLITAGTVTIVTGAGQTENFGGATLPPGFALTVEFTQITSNASVIVTW